MKKTILITGGTGFIGYHLAKALKKKFKIISLSSKQPTDRRKIKNVVYLKCDLFKKKLLFKSLDNFKVDYVINLAGYIDHSNKKQTLNSHYYGCKNLVDYFRLKKNLELFLQIGSSLEYGKKNSPHHEKLKGNPDAVYGQSKLKSTNYIFKIAKKNKFRFIVLRLYQIYGPNQEINRLIPIVISSCLKNKKFKCSNGVQVRDFLYVDDLVNLFKKILLSKKKITGVFNVGSNKPSQVKKVIKMIQLKIKKGQPQFGKIPMRKDESLNYYPDLKKIKKKISWRPKVSLSKGLSKTINYYKSVISV